MGSVVSAVGNVFSGIGSALGGGKSGSTGSPAPLAQSQTDPFGAIGGRTDAATQLQGFMNNPASAMSSPGYQQQLQQGTQAMQAAGAASGTLQSGAQMNALQSLGQSTFGSYYQQMLSNLGSLSGATSQTPAGAASAQTQSAALAYNAQNQNAQNAMGLTGLALGGASAAGLFSPSGYSGQFVDVGGQGAAADAAIAAFM